MFEGSTKVGGVFGAGDLNGVRVSVVKIDPNEDEGVFHRHREPATVSQSSWRMGWVIGDEAQQFAKVYRVGRIAIEATFCQFVDLAKGRSDAW